MSSPQTQPPWDFLLSASRNSLQSFELSRLSHSANLRKEIGALLDQWLEENLFAMLARLLLQQRDWPPREPESALAGEFRPEDARSASYNFFADRGAAPPASGGSA